MFVAILAIAAVGFIACGGDDNSPTGSSSFEAAPLPNVGSGSGSAPPPSTSGNSGGPTNNPPATPGEFFTILNKPSDFNPWLDCRSSTGQFDNGFDFLVRIDNADVNYHVVQNVWWRADASCEPINGRGDGAVAVGSSASLEERNGGKHLKFGFRPSPNKCGGHYQADYTFVNDDTGERFDFFFVALNTGRDGKEGPCNPPPPEGCPEGQIEEGGKCYPICDQETNQVNLRGLGVASTTTDAPACRCPSGEVPHELFGCREPKCTDFEPPSISFSPDVTTTADKVTLNDGDASPPGGTYDPNLPQEKTRPDHDQSADEIGPVKYTLPWSPDGYENLECSTSDTFTVPVPPKEPTCEEKNPATVVSFSFDGSHTTAYNCKRVGLCGRTGGNCRVNDANRCIGRLSGTDYGPANEVTERVNPLVCEATVSGPGDWVMSLGTETRPVSSSGSGDKATDKETLGCPGRTTLRTSYNWKTHGDDHWTCAVYVDGSEEHSQTIDDP